MSPTGQAVFEKMVFHKTNTKSGRHIFVTPSNSTMQHLSYARIMLDSSASSASFSNGEHETGLVCLSGAAEIKVGSERFRLGQYDSIYIPRHSQIEVSTSGQADLAEFSSDVDHDYPLQFVPYSSVAENSALSFSTGGPNQTRQVSILIGENVDAGRLLLGFTISEPGNWTSWPPHEHSKMLEEMYVYFNMPEPAFGLQLVYKDTAYPELVAPVRDGDAVLMPAGYHPNVSVPGHRITFLWAMAAHREKEDRQFGVVNVQAGFNQGGSGLEASRK